MLAIVLAVPALVIPVASCQALTRSGATYVLQNDVSAPGTCFSMQANGITLNLNGHTLHYGSQGGAHARYGVVGMPCWDPDLNNGRANENPCGNTYDNITIMNGAIVQSSAAPPYSHAIRFGQGGTSKVSIHDVRITVSARSSIPISVEYGNGGLHIFNNTIRNDVTEIANRHSLEGMSIKSEGDSACRTPNVINNNVIIGGAQGGILTRCNHSQIYSNDIAQSAHYTNDYAIYASGQFQDVHDNYIHPSQGRGIGGGDGDTHGTRIHHNRIVVIEKATNQEYSGCQIDGTYGITQRSTYGIEIDHNDITANSDECGASGIKMTEDLGSGGTTPILIHDNTVKVVNVSGRATQPLRGISYDTTTPACCIFENNSITSDGYFAGVNWDGGDKGIFLHNTYILGSNPIPGQTGLMFWGCGRRGGSTRDWVFRDMDYQNGARPNTRMLTMGSNGGCATSYFIQWTYSLAITDAAGKPIPGVSVTISDAERQTYAAMSDVSGHVTFVLTQESHANAFAHRDAVTPRNPHQVMLSHPACSAQNFTFSITTATSETRQLTCQ